MKENAGSAELEGRVWFVFCSRGMASMAVGDNITKAIAEWRKRKGKSGGEVIGAIKASGPLSVERMHMEGTHVYGVICCLHKEGQKKC